MNKLIIILITLALIFFFECSCDNKETFTAKSEESTAKNGSVMNINHLKQAEMKINQLQLKKDVKFLMDSQSSVYKNINENTDGLKNAMDSIGSLGVNVTSHKHPELAFSESYILSPIILKGISLLEYITDDSILIDEDWWRNLSLDDECIQLITDTFGFEDADWAMMMAKGYKDGDWEYIASEMYGKRDVTTGKQDYTPPKDSGFDKLMLKMTVEGRPNIPLSECSAEIMTPLREHVFGWITAHQDFAGALKKENKAVKEAIEMGTISDISDSLIIKMKDVVL